MEGEDEDEDESEGEEDEGGVVPMMSLATIVVAVNDAV